MQTYCLIFQAVFYRLISECGMSRPILRVTMSYLSRDAMTKIQNWPVVERSQILELL